VRVAIVHDWLVTYAGAERVLEKIVRCYPSADLFSLVDFIPNEQRAFLKNKTVSTSFIQRLPFAKKKYRQYLPLMPWAIKRFDLSEYDLILSSSHAVAKGVQTTPHQLHLSYIHTPMRYAWDLREQYLEETGLNNGIKGWATRRLLQWLRRWDEHNTRSVGGLIANSHFIAQRIKKNYARDSEVIYPPVETDSFDLRKEKEDFYLTASRFVPYKKIDLIVEVFSSFPDKKLVVIGDGPEFKKISGKAGPNISLLGYQTSEVLKDHMQRAKAFVFAAEEDFGITVVEAQACGTPVIALGRGGALETVKGLNHEKPTGVFFPEQTVESLTQAIAEFEAHRSKILPENCRENAMRFSSERFREEFKDYVEGQWKLFQEKLFRSKEE
jgi:glycosyltransferase involved in cell wall biosynthesis